MFCKVTYYYDRLIKVYLIVNDEASTNRAVCVDNKWL